MSGPKLLACALLLALAGYALGRFTAASRVEIRREVVEKVVREQVQVVAEAKTVREIEVTRPDGTRIVRRVTQAERKVATEVHETAERKSVEQETRTSRRGISLSVLAGHELGNLSSPMIYGGQISKPVLGPITAGIFALSSGVAGVSLGMEF